MANCRSICMICLAVIGVVLTIIASVMFLIIPDFLNKMIGKQLQLKPLTERTQQWADIKVPIYFKIWPYHVVNAQEVMESGVKPLVEQRGPYVFRQKRRKRITGWHDENRKIGYKLIREFFFEPTLSNGSLSDNITVTNAPLISLIGKLQSSKMGSHVSIITKNFLNRFTNEYNEKLFEERTVGEVLFDGYKVTFLHELTKFALDFKIKLPEMLPDNEFAFFKMKNFTYGPNIVADTGIENMNDFTKIYTVDGKKEVSYWNGVPGNNKCNQINGTDGAQFHPNFGKDEKAWIFNDEFCRSVYMTYVEDMYVKGIKMYKFAAPPEIGAPPRPGSENECYCINPGDQFCENSGVFDLSTCRKGAPIVLSGPHFMGTEPEFRRMVHGLNPNKAIHSSYIAIEPMTGSVMAAARRIQINLRIKRDNQIDLISNVQDDFLMPLLWLEESAKVDDENAYMFKSKLVNTITLLSVVNIGSMVLGLILIIFAAIIWILIKKNQFKASIPHRDSFECIQIKNKRSRTALEFSKKDILLQE